MKTLQYLVIHCTATPAGRRVTADDIRRWHLSPTPAGRGWKQVGYSDMVHQNGYVENLVANNDDNIVDIWEITNGVKGINSISRHVVYVGGVLPESNTAADTRTVAQKIALENYVKERVKAVPSLRIAGHNQFAAKACPCFDVPSWLRAIGISERNIYKPSKETRDV